MQKIQLPLLKFKSSSEMWHRAAQALRKTTINTVARVLQHKTAASKEQLRS